MILPHRMFIGVLLALIGAGAALPQDVKKSVSEEDNRLNRIIERWIELNETERDRVAREVGRGHNGKVPEAFDDWYERLGGNENGWDRALIQRDNAREIFDRIAYRIQLDGPILGRDEFVGYAKRYWRKDTSPLWRDSPRFDTGAEAEQLFKRLDTDKDGYFSSREMAPDLRNDLKRWDKTRDGWISLDEYRGYFAYRLDKIYRDWQQKSERRLPPLEVAVPNDEEKPRVVRAARLPTGLPAWFAQLDSDQDGQVGLYEWRMADWTLDEFGKLDGNDDGFLEPGELIRLLAMTERDGTRPYAYLLQLKARAKAP